jgi:hypothetical protein
MFKDPTTHWPDGFPYDLLAPAGITPDSSMKEIMNAGWSLMPLGGMTPEVRQAWDTLRDPAQRLMVDFFMYHSDAIADFFAAADSAQQEEDHGRAD